MPFFKRKAASFKGFLHNLSGYCLLKKSKFFKGKLQKNDKCFFASRGSFIVVFKITFRTRIQYAKFMLHITDTYVPFTGRLYLFSGKSCVQKMTRYFAGDCGKVHATISMLLRCKYISILLFLSYVYS